MTRRALLLICLGIAALVLAGVAIGGPGPVGSPPVVTIDYAGPSTVTAGTIISYSASANDDEDDPDPIPTCSPPSPITAVEPSVTITCNATDLDGNAAVPATLTVTVDPAPPPLDTIPPTVTVPASTTLTATGPGGANHSFTATAFDVVDGSRPVICSPPSGSTFPIDSTTVTCTASDLSGNVGSGSFVVTVQDEGAPDVVVTPAAVTLEATGPGGASATFTASVTDDVDSGLKASCVPPSGSTFALGTNSATCTATDSAGNLGSGSISVTVIDTTPPAFTGVPGSITVQAPGSGGGVATFPTPAGSDLVAGPRPVTCVPASGSTFAFGTTKVVCTADDGSGNSASTSFFVTVQDPAAPVVTVPGSRTVEANGPTGAVVNYDPPSAQDNKDGANLLVTCDRASGSTFPLGTTTVSCKATDKAGNTGSASFAVTVQDTTKPTILAPGDLELKSSDPVPSSAPAIQSWFAPVKATDLVDSTPTVTVNLPATFPLGTTTVPISAVDDAGNKGFAFVRVTVSAATGVSPASTPTPDLTPPSNVQKIKAKLGDRTTSLAWSNPAATDFDHVEITRSPGKRGAAQSLVYKGKGTSFKDSGLVPGTEYRYLIVTFDQAGNHTAGVAVVVVGRLQRLVAPAPGARLARPPLLVWRAVAGADYYNVQIYKGKRKILSIWPKSPRYKLGSRWRYEGHAHRFSAGTYSWYVWPGFGALADAKYGEMLGKSEFVVARRR